MHFVAYGISVRSGCGNEKVQRLHSRITGALGHYIKKLSVWLGMKFVENNTMYIEAMLTVGFS